MPNTSRSKSTKSKPGPTSSPLPSKKRKAVATAPPDQADGGNPARRQASAKEQFNARDYFLADVPPPPVITPLPGDIFEFSPRACDALALWMLSRGELVNGWRRFVERLERHIQENTHAQVEELVADHWHAIRLGEADQLWAKPGGCLLRITPKLDKLKFVFLMPDFDNAPVEQPSQGRPLAMQALEVLKDVKATAIAMNGIHGSNASVMRRAVDDWIARGDSGDVAHIYLVDRTDEFRSDAWAQFMLDTLAWDAGGRQGAEPWMNEYLDGIGPSPERGRTFLDVRDAEAAVLHAHCDPAKTWKVLDCGCGVARHLQWLQGVLLNAQLHGIECNPQLLEKCRQRVPEAHFVRTVQEVQDRDFNLVLLLGSNLGMFGGGHGLRRHLRSIHASMQVGGLLVGESNPVQGRHWKVGDLTLKYEGCHDSWFQWGFFTPDFARASIENAGFTVIPASHERFWSPSGHGNGFIIVAKRNPTDGTRPVDTGPKKRKHS